MSARTARDSRRGRELAWTQAALSVQAVVRPQRKLRDNHRMTNDRFMLIHDPEFQAGGERVLGVEFNAMSERVLQVTELTSQLNVLPFDDDAGKAALLEQILGAPAVPVGGVKVV
jgi:hypothetical protein